MARHINPSNSTNKTIDAIDRKRERERIFMLKNARDNSRELAVSLVQKLLDSAIIETNAVIKIQEEVAKQLQSLVELEEFEMRYKIAPVRNLTQDPNIVSLYLTQFIVEDLINHPNIQDIYGEDLDVYLAVESVLSALRP